MRHLLICFCILAVLPALWSQNALATAEKLTAQKDYRSSSALLEAYITEHPSRRYDLARAWWLLSYNHLQAGELVVARAANAQSTQLRRELRSGDLAENYLRTAQIELSAAQPQQALAAAEQGLQMMIEDTETYVLLHLVAAKAHAALGQYDWVEIYLETTASILTIELPPQSPAAIEAYYTAAEIELQQGNITAARYWYLRAVRYDEDLSRLHKLFQAVYPLPE